MKQILIVLLSFYGFSTFAQTTIKGTVKDKQGEPIPGVNIIIEGTSSGASTDFDGNFTLVTSLTGKQTLRASFIGFKTFGYLYLANFFMLICL